MKITTAKITGKRFFYFIALSTLLIINIQFNAAAASENYYPAVNTKISDARVSPQQLQSRPTTAMGEVLAIQAGEKVVYFIKQGFASATVGQTVSSLDVEKTVYNKLKQLD